MRKILSSAKAVLSLILVLTLSLALAACGATTISLNEYVTVSFATYNGFGSPSLEIDKEGINTLVEKEKVVEYVSSLSKNEIGAALAQEFTFSDLIDFQFKGSYENLSNGDKVEVEVVLNDLIAASGETLSSMQEALKISLKSTTFSFTVEGLEEAKILDAMSFIDEYIVYEGANGGATAAVKFPKDFVHEIDGFSFVRDSWYANKVEIVYEHKTVGYVSYQCYPGTDLSKGQEIKIAAETGGSINLSGTGYVLNDTKTVTVPDLGEYVTSKDQITAELKAAITAEIDAIIAEEEYEGVEIHGYYWGTLKSSATTNNVAEEKYRIFVVFSYDGFWGSKDYINYGTTKLIALPDGTYKVEFVVMSASDAPEKTMDENYDCEEIAF